MLSERDNTADHRICCNKEKMMGDLESVPRRTDPFERALTRVDEGTNRFGARRDGIPHPGMDLFVPKNTPVALPAEGAVLIGVTHHARTGAGRTMGNALIFFVPDPDQPYFLALLHLSAKTFSVLKERDIGAVLGPDSGRQGIVAYSGNTAAGKSGAHLHVTATTTFMYGGNVYTAADFLRRHQEGTLGEFMERRNFRSIMTPARVRNERSLEGYLNPLDLIQSGRLRISSQPQAQRVSQARAEERKVTLR
jgi:hypothetical protein